MVTALQQILPGGSSTNGLMDSDDAEDCHMKPVADIEEEIKNRHRIGKQASSNAYDSDEDEDVPRGAQRVQCAQQ